MSNPTAAMLVIGDEILKGSTADTNTMVAAKALREHSVHLKRVVVVSDDQDNIVQEILSMQQEVGTWFLVLYGDDGDGNSDVYQISTQ